MAKAKAKKEPKKKESKEPAKAIKATKAAKVVTNTAKASPPKISAAKAAELSEEASQLLKKWQKLNKQYSEEASQAYLITGAYDIKSLLTHKIHGWGIVLNRRENYIDVLFESGMKTLIMNFKD